ncbi:MAG TPA: hypothetical protein PK303_03300 [bacterium]|nr:hypothetical protein [bacterium]
MRIKISSDIPHGNVCDVSIETKQDNATVYFASSPKEGPQALWFCFRMITTKKTEINKTCSQTSL